MRARPVRVTRGVTVEGCVSTALTLRAPLSERGALFVSGEVKLESAALGALDQLALVSGGRLAVSGRGKDTCSSPKETSRSATPASPDTPLLLPSDFFVRMKDGSTKTLDELGIFSMVTGLTADSMTFGLQSLALDAARTSVSDAGAGKLSLNLNKF